MPLPEFLPFKNCTILNESTLASTTVEDKLNLHRDTKVQL
jgi:hypothetical protein